MKYTIGEVAEKTGLSTHTLRYYEKDGISRPIKRKENGLREYTDEDIALLKVINCLKETGMSIKDIKNYVKLCEVGDNTIEERKEIFIKQKKYIEEEIEKLNKHLETAKYKIKYYENLENEKDLLDCKNN